VGHRLHNADILPACFSDLPTVSTFGKRRSGTVVMTVRYDAERLADLMTAPWFVLHSVLETPVCILLFKLDVPLRYVGRRIDGKVTVRRGSTGHVRARPLPSYKAQLVGVGF